jgi:hypothetical protein
MRWLFSQSTSCVCKQEHIESKIHSKTVGLTCE